MPTRPKNYVLTNVSKDVINKILHDPAFDIAYKCISPKVIFQNKKI